MGIFIFIAGIILFSLLIVVHEWGHFITARRNGVKVEEFGLFFPPRLYRKKMKSGFDLTINAVPIGGFVKLKGEHDSDTEPGSFGAATLWAKTKIMGAGVFMNLVVALLIFTFLAAVGMPVMVDNQFTVKSDTSLVSSRVLVIDVDKNSPASHAGLRPLDEITDIGLPGRSPVGISNAEDLPSVTKSFAGQSATIYFVRDGKQMQGNARLLTTKEVAASQNTKNPKGYLGVSPKGFSMQRSTWSAPVVALGFAAQVTSLTFQGLGHALAGLGSLIAGFFTGNSTARQHGQTNASAQVAGPVGIVVIMKDGSVLGYQFMLLIIGIISLTLAIMNLLPIPALDGGRLWITLIAHGLKRPLSAEREETINATGFVILMSLFLLITIVDVTRIF